MKDRTEVNEIFGNTPVNKTAHFLFVSLNNKRRCV